MIRLILSMSLVFGLFCFGMMQTANAHENGVYKHLKGAKIGPDVIAITQCASNAWVLLVDTDGDKIHDEAYFVFNKHDETHYKPLDPNKCSCESAMKGELR
jgi:hypothetical protein